MNLDDTDNCPRDDAQYVWIVDDYMQIGTVADYAQAWANEHYRGDPVSRVVWRPSTPACTLMSCRVTVSYEGTDHNDYMHYKLSIGDSSAYVSIDGRA